MKNKKIVLSVVVCLIIGLLSFWGGMVFSNSKKPINQFANRQGDFSQNSGGRINQGVRGGMSGELISGEVLSIDTESITLKLRDGGSKIIFFSPTTKIEKTVDGIISDVVIGKTIMINGTSNSDGSINATLIQIRF
jgi:hypothetical protein